MKTYAHFIIYTDDVPGGPNAILGPSGCTKDVDRISAMGTIYLDLEVHDERIAKVVALLEAAGKDPSPSYFDRYTEEELQSAPLLLVNLWKHVGTWTSPSYGVTYDFSEACSTCGTGIRQSSPLIVNGGEMLSVNKYRVSCAGDENFLVRDADVEKLIAANVTGVNFWPIKAIYKGGIVGEIRWQQAADGFVQRIFRAGEIFLGVELRGLGCRTRCLGCRTRLDGLWMSTSRWVVIDFIFAQRDGEVARS